MSARFARLRLRRPNPASPIGRLAREENGQALFLFVGAVVVLIGFLALSIDVGGWFASDRNLQKGADNAAVAAADKYAYQTFLGTPIPATNPCVGSADWSACATTVAGLNGVTIDALPAPVTSGTNTVLTVKVKDASPPNAFASFFGIHPTIRRSASATVGPSGGGGNVMPFAFSSTDAATWASGSTHTYAFGGTAGDFGLLLLPNCTGGTTVTATCISPSGCGCSLTAPITEASNTGNNWKATGIVNAFNDLIAADVPVFVPVYSPPAGGSYNIIGFAGFIVTGYNKNTPSITGKFVAIVNGTLCSGSCQSFGSFAIGLSG